MPINRPFIRLQLLPSIKDSTHSLGHCTGNKIHPENLSFLQLVPLCYYSQLKSSQVQGKESEFFNKDTAPEHGRDLTWNGTGKELEFVSQVSCWEWNNQEALRSALSTPSHSWESGHVLQDSRELIFLITPYECPNILKMLQSHCISHFSPVSARQEKDSDNGGF